MIDSLGDRMKRYEAASRTVLTPRMPIIIRVDGKAFHTYTRPLKETRPDLTVAKNFFDPGLSLAMMEVSTSLCSGIQGARFAYTQSDEVSVLIYYHKRFNSSAWFDGQAQKIVSVAASIAAGVMTAESPKVFAGETHIAAFDARAFTIPEEDVCNYFVWRQQDCIRNSVQSWGLRHFGPSKCKNMSQVKLKQMCDEAGCPWESSLDRRWRYGVDVQRSGYGRYDALDVLVLHDSHKWEACEAYPLFQEDRLHIEQHLAKEEG